MIVSASGLSVLVPGAAKTYGYQITSTLQICRHPSSTIQLCSVAFHILAFVTAFGLSRALVLDAEYNGLKAPLGFSASVSRVDRMDKWNAGPSSEKSKLEKTLSRQSLHVAYCTHVKSCSDTFVYMLIYYIYISCFYACPIAYHPLIIPCTLHCLLVFSLPESGLERLGDCASKRCLDIWSGCRCCLYI